MAGFLMQQTAWEAAVGFPEKVLRQNLHRQRVTRIDSTLGSGCLDMFIMTPESLHRPAAVLTGRHSSDQRNYLAFGI